MLNSRGIFGPDVNTKIDLSVLVSGPTSIGLLPCVPFLGWWTSSVGSDTEDGKQICDKRDCRRVVSGLLLTFRSSLFVRGSN